MSNSLRLLNSKWSCSVILNKNHKLYTIFFFHHTKPAPVFPALLSRVISLEAKLRATATTSGGANERAVVNESPVNAESLHCEEEKRGGEETRKLKYRIKAKVAQIYKYACLINTNQ